MGDADPEPLLEAGLYRGPGARLDATGWLGRGQWRRAGAPRHDPRVASFAWTAAEPLAGHDVESALETLTGLMGERILRLKGLVNVAGEPGPRAVHAVRHTLYPSARLERWPDADRTTRIVVIGLDLEEDSVARILDSFLAPAPR
jgi:G3E family GTPase